MKEKPIPSFGAEQPERICERQIGWTAEGEEIICNREPVAHVFWTREDLANGFPCAEHLREIQERWRYYVIHPMGADCGMPGALFFEEENVCRREDLPVAERPVLRRDTLLIQGREA